MGQLNFEPLPCETRQQRCCDRLQSDSGGQVAARQDQVLPYVKAEDKLSLSMS
jgi:hypothetical protein